MGTAIIRTIFAQPAEAGVRTQLDTVADMLGEQFPKVSQMRLEAKDGLTRLRGLTGRTMEEDPVHRPAGADQPRD
ncbi:hypothetical protein [Kitasatospora sp. NPDC057738]|uniref:hypothetical protein n=1 Tax=Kitasatospora sp. NPDC057738 TaxID=3346233 RepID=UPI0036A19EF4